LVRRVCKCICVFKIGRMRDKGNEGKERERARVGRAKNERNTEGDSAWLEIYRMTERAPRCPIGGDDCQNRTARRYEKCSYLWHYFRRFEPFRPSPPPPTRASRIALPCPFSVRLLTPARIFSAGESPYPPSFREARVVLTSSPRSSLRASVSASLPLLPPVPAPYVLLHHPHRHIPRRSGRGPHHHRRARTTGRDRPHCRGHHFNVTLIKSNNQYLLRKKF